MLSVAGNDYHKKSDTENEDQAPPAYEKAFSALQSKQKGIRRINFRDTDDNSSDAEIADYSQPDVSVIFPHSLSFGAWDENTTLIAEINAVKKLVPKFYETYCTPETVSTLSAILTEIDGAISASDTEALAGLKSQLEAALGNVAYKYDSKIAQVYVATDKGDGTSYGTSLTKAIGYVPAQMVVVGTDGGIMAEDLSWSGQIKVRGNSTSGGAKRPYNMKFTSKFDLFGFGASKKWVLLADFFDPTLMRNKIAMDLGEMLGLEATTGHQRVEVWVDGSYRGMYLLTEKIEADTNRVDIKTKNGDFLIELDWRTDADSVYMTSTVLNKRFKMHEPEEPTDDQKTVILETLGRFETAIKSGTWDEVKEVADTESFVAFYVINELMKTVDFGGTSVYFYCKDGKMYAGPVWDYDLSSGNLGTYYSAGYHSTDNIFAGTAHYLAYMTKFTEFQLSVSERLRQLENEGFLQHIFNDADSDITFYTEAITRNNSVWDPSVTRGGTMQLQAKATYEANLAFLKSWLTSRDLWMTDYFLNRTYISASTFPDSALLTHARTLDTDSDSFLSTAEKSAVTSIDLSGLNLTSLNLTGLEVFTNLVSLNITDNPQLAWVNVHNFTGLNITYDETTTALVDALPSFSAHSLVLSGQIGVDFYIDIPEGTDTRGAYADFTLNTKTGNPAMFDNAEHTGGNTYMFTSYINSVQMADTISAAFHYGGETITQDYRAKDYLDKVIASADEFSAELVSLVKAIKDYGHYVQIPLARYNSWEIGVKHAEMDCANPDIASDSPDIMAALESYALKMDNAGSGIASVMMDLELDSETTLNMYLIRSGDYSGNVAAYIDGSGENMAVEQSDGSYCVSIGGISAHKLGDTYTIHVVAGKEFDVKASALSYAYAVMKSSDDTDLKKAVIALYKYYDAAMTYRGSAGY